MGSQCINTFVHGMWLAALLGVSTAVAQSNHVYILTGQSNSLGAVKGTPATAEQLENYKSDGLLWNGNMVRNTGERFEKSPSWSTVAPQLPNYVGSLCMGPEYGFCSIMQRHKWHTAKADRVAVIKASLDGGNNSCWLPDAPGYKSLSATVKEALAALQGRYQVHALLYLQGESDGTDVEITEAPARFLSLLTRVGKETKKGAIKYAVVGECATWNGRENKNAAGDTTAGLLGDMARKKKNVGWVRTRDLTKITAGDSMGVHYDGKSQITIGARYAYAIATLEKLSFPPTRNDDPQAPLTSPAAWWGGKAPQADQTATWDVAAANVAEEKVEKDWSIGGLVVDDPFSGQVSLCSSNKNKPCLIIGAKGIALKKGDLSIQLPVTLTGDQSWKLSEGRTLTIGSVNDPVKLDGVACISVKAEPGTTLELHLSELPQVRWTLPSPLPNAKITISGKPAQFAQEGEYYTLSSE